MKDSSIDSYWRELQRLLSQRWIQPLQTVMFCYLLIGQNGESRVIAYESREYLYHLGLFFK